MTPPLRVFVTGATGCAGSHLCEWALAKGATVFGVADRGCFTEGVDGRHIEIGQRDLLSDWLAECRPDRVFHLAALVHGTGSHAPEDLLRVNVAGTCHLLESVRRRAPGARVLVAGSSGIYGRSPEPGRPITEDAPLRPGSAYAVSKAAQDLMAWQYHAEHGLHTVRARTFNQTGPREPAGLVCASLARQVARIESGLQEPVLRISTLGTSRDFCDVRDVVEGYWAALEHGAPGEAYNICSGRGRSIREVVEILLGHGRTGPVALEESLPFPDGRAILHQVGDASRLRACSGWEPRISLEQSLGELLDEWRSWIGGRP